MDYNENLSYNEKIQILMSLSPLTFLILYKLFDQIVLNRLGRHIYFYVKLGVDWESDDQTKLEWILQTILVFIPLYLAGLGLLIF
jgi:hypothetical protein